VVNAGGQNIRLGLVGIHVLDRNQLISAAEQAVTNSSDFFRNLDITGTGLGASSFWSGLPSPVALTDAAGEFRVSIHRSNLILARASILMGNESKQFVWVIPAKDLGDSPVLLSNHNLFEGNDASAALILSLPGIAEVAKLRRLAEQAGEKERELVDIGSKNESAARSSTQAGKQAAEIVASKHPIIDKAFGRLAVVSNAWTDAVIFAQNAAAFAAEANAPLMVSAAEVAKSEATAALQVARASAQDAENAQNSIVAKNHRELALNAASRAKTASAKAIGAANSADGFYRDIVKAVQPLDRRLEIVGRFAASAKDLAKDATEASRQAELYANDAQKSVALKESLERAIEAALAAVDARIRSQKASMLASNELNSARAVEALSAAKAASLAASQAESSLDQVTRALQSSRELSSADLPKLVRESADAKEIADQGANEGNRALGELELAANAAPELVTRLSTNTLSIGMREVGTNIAKLIGGRFKQGQSIVSKIIEAVEASARGRQNADEAFVSSFLPLTYELVNSVEANAEKAKGIAESLSITNLSLVNANDSLDKVQALRQMVEVESSVIGRINLGVKNTGAVNINSSVEKAISIVHDAYTLAAERLVEASVEPIETMFGDIKKQSVSESKSLTNFDSCVTFCNKQKQKFDVASSLVDSIADRLSGVKSQLISTTIQRIRRLKDESLVILLTDNEKVHLEVRKLSTKNIETASVEWARVKDDSSSTEIEESKGIIERILINQLQLNKIPALYPASTTTKNDTDKLQLNVSTEIKRLIEQLDARLQQIESNRSKAISEAMAKLQKAKKEPGGRVVIDLPVCWIPPGQFTIGSPIGEEGRDLDEVQHEVILTRGFFLAETECTQGQWEAVMGGDPSSFKGSERPVEQVSWGEAVEYCQKLTTKQRAEGILPEGWEWGCRQRPNGSMRLELGRADLAIESRTRSHGIMATLGGRPIR